jgi:ribonuclease HI
MNHVFRRLGHEGGSWCRPGLHLTSGVRMEYLVRLHFPTSNNVAEYEALINGLRIAVELGI